MADDANDSKPGDGKPEAELPRVILFPEGEPSRELLLDTLADWSVRFDRLERIVREDAKRISRIEAALRGEGGSEWDGLIHAMIWIAALAVLIPLLAPIVEKLLEKKSKAIEA